MGLKNYLMSRKDGNNDRYKMFIGQNIIKQLKDAGAVLALLSNKADGSGPLTGNDSPWVDLSGQTTDYTLTNEIVNGDFSNGTTNTTSSNSSTIIINNVAVNTANGGSSQPRLDVQSIGSISANDKWFVYFRIRVTNSDCTFIRVRTSNPTTDIQINSPNINEWYELYSSKTFTSSTNETALITHAYVDSLTANGKVMEIDGNAGMIAINMTSIGLESLSDKEMLSLVQGGYFTTKNIKRANNGTLNNLAGTPTSGWNSDSGENFLTFDGVDDFVQFADTASLDITEAPLAIGVTLKVDTDHFGFPVCKNLSGFSDVQYSLFTRTGRTIEFSRGGNTYAQFVYSDSIYINVLFCWDGANIIAHENGIQKAQTAFGGPLISSGTLFLGKREVSLGFFDGDIATVTIYTGSDIQKILDIESKISAHYLALNP